MATPLLHATVRGHGPTLVLLHGFLGSSRYWKKVTELVDQDYQVVAIDLLGFGDSPKPRKSAYNYNDHIESISATLEHLGIRGQFTLMGHSMGSLLALRFANLYPERITQLLLTNMPIMLGKAEVYQTIRKSCWINNIGLMPYMHRVTWTIFRTLHKMRILPHTARARVNESRDFLFQHTANSRIKSFQNVIEQAQVELDLYLVNVKTVLLTGVEDHQIYLDNLMTKIRLSPQVVLETYQTGHHIPRLMPEIIADKLRR